MHRDQLALFAKNWAPIGPMPLSCCRHAPTAAATTQLGAVHTWLGFIDDRQPKRNECSFSWQPQRERRRRRELEDTLGIWMDWAMEPPPPPPVWIPQRPGQRSSLKGPGPSIHCFSDPRCEKRPHRYTRPQVAYCWVPRPSPQLWTLRWENVRSSLRVFQVVFPLQSAIKQ